MIYTYPDAEAKPAAPKLPAAGGQPPPEPTFLVGPRARANFLVGTEDSQQPGEGYPLKVVAEHAADNTQVTAAVVWYCFAYPRTHMYLVKKKWGGGARHTRGTRSRRKGGGMACAPPPPCP